MQTAQDSGARARQVFLGKIGGQAVGGKRPGMKQLDEAAAGVALFRQIDLEATRQGQRRWRDRQARTSFRSCSTIMVISGANVT